MVDNKKDSKFDYDLVFRQFQSQLLTPFCKDGSGNRLVIGGLLGVVQDKTLLSIMEEMLRDKITQKGNPKELPGNIFELGYSQFSVVLSGYAGHITYSPITEWILGGEIAEKCKTLELDKTETYLNYQRKYNNFNPEFLFSFLLDFSVAGKDPNKQFIFYLKEEILSTEDRKVITNRLDYLLNILEVSETYYDRAKEFNPWDLLIGLTREMYAKLNPDSNKDFIKRGIIQYQEGCSSYIPEGLILESPEENLFLRNCDKQDKTSYVDKKAIAVYTKTDIEIGTRFGRLAKIIN